MSRNLAFVLSFTGIFVVMFLVYMIFFTIPAINKITGKKKPKNGKKVKSIMEVEYLCAKFKLDKSKLNYNELKIMLPLLNSLIITLVTLIIELIKVPMILRFLIGFILLIGLIYSVYEIYGRHLLKKERKK